MSNINHPYFVPIRFRGADKSYFFSTDIEDLQIGEQVVVDSVNGYTMGIVAGPLKSVAEYHSDLDLKAVMRRPTKSDMLNHNFNLKEEKRALEIVDEEIKKLGLPMDLVEANYTLDGTYITITYTTPEKRVDFRELLNVIKPALGCRVELRQIAPRDRAKNTGGIGICGLPLCCSTFLTGFESISIGKAKNQMLTLNIPKLSGHCGKLICCLQFEDEAYTEAKKAFPAMGTPIHTPEGEYFVDSFNIISRSVRLVNKDRSDFKIFDLEDIVAMQNGTYKEHIKIVKKKEEELPNFGIVPERKENNPQSQERNNPNQNQGQQNNKGNQNQGRHNNHHNNRHHGQNNGQNPNMGQNKGNPNNNNRPNNNPQNRPEGKIQDGQGNRNGHRHHRFYHHGKNKPNNGGGNQ